MFGLLNPALAPLKAKVLAFAAGAAILLLLAAVGSSTVLFNMWQRAQVAIGSLNAQLEQSDQLNRDNQVVWDQKAANYEQRIKNGESLKQVAEEAAKAARDRELLYNRKLAAALKKLKESTDADKEAREWAVVPVPDAVVVGMCRAAQEALGEAAGCRVDQDGVGEDPGLPPAAVPDSPAT